MSQPCLGTQGYTGFHFAKDDPKETLRQERVSYAIQHFGQILVK